MLVFRTCSEMQVWRASLDHATRVAFVPTMGYLHEGHLSLLREARRRGDRLVLSIFVNPTQFGPNEDLARYPRDEAGDLAKASECGVDVAFCPTDPRELYPQGTNTWVEVQGLDRHLCGASRPGHFRGVCTVVAKLWGLVRPDVALFGEKDFQQLAILRRMHADLFLGGEVVGMPIVREPDGLAMSSRNANLSPEARAQALAISRWLAAVRQRFEAGEREATALLGDPAAALAPGRVDYASLVDADDLQPVTEVAKPALCAVAAFFGGVRLIDNTVLRP
ncbi:pantothenate synthetase [Nannocystis exedens]|uniref:Pantothenate synthetase n=1 Tax=Nannocystis exedens TaxID=54 RepID=A0A1I1VPV3_9BACT|nr:pantoate--beta-alanine ligase [Nannocystis exedens]PCC72727.1 pantoate-beta-alanine ligase [Nannocystis exedens]SFD84981.1 pantothenate synthetase [Nannocystis exedens]